MAWGREQVGLWGPREQSRDRRQGYLLRSFLIHKFYGTHVVGNNGFRNKKMKSSLPGRLSLLSAIR